MTDSTDRVTINDLAALRYCNKGGRQFFELHGLDWNEFRKNGFPLGVLSATGDAMAMAVEEHARNRIAGERK
jgi:hypothetical protein